MIRSFHKIIPSKVKTIFVSSRKKIDYKVIDTNTPNVYTCDALDPNFDFKKSHPESLKLFALSTRFIPPEEFKFELPRARVPEFAFVGRSNVGKSSLIRALLNNDIVRVSKEPGCTKTINYYAFERERERARMYLVDLPGYGFGKASKKDREGWERVMSSYLTQRDFTVLRRVYVLIDSRRGLLEADKQMLLMLSTFRISHQVILTKSDLIDQKSLSIVLERLFQDIMGKQRQSCLPIVHVVSALKDEGLLPLKQSITEIAVNSCYI
mmetsp:Transcript_10715/g.10768  ORF Transcript_10715/g.10768 Transcript_10715/m.10768 type:complete len:267 (+) Transcript_10715:204-1004(+)